jgi:hypothetical protein
MVRIEITFDETKRAPITLDLDVTPILAARFFGWQMQLSQMDGQPLPDIVEAKYVFALDFMRRAGVPDEVAQALPLNAACQIPDTAIENSGVPNAVVGKYKARPLT